MNLFGLRHFREWVLRLLSCASLESDRQAKRDRAPTPEAEELIPTIPTITDFVAGGKTVIQVTCPYCGNAHWHLMRPEARKKSMNRKGQLQVGKLICKAECGWGHYQVE